MPHCSSAAIQFLSLAAPQPFTEAHESAQRLAAKWKLIRLMYERGWDKARVIGFFKVLLRLLVTRFGPLPEAVVARLRAGTEADHARWAERLLTAPSLDAVFSDEPPATH